MLQRMTTGKYSAPALPGARTATSGAAARPRGADLGGRAVAGPGRTGGPGGGVTQGGHALARLFELPEAGRIEGRDPGSGPEAEQLREVLRAGRGHPHAVPGEPGADRQMVGGVEPADQRPAVAREPHDAGPAVLDRGALGDQAAQALLDRG